MKRFLGLIAIALTCAASSPVWAQDYVVQVVRVPSSHRDQAGSHIYSNQEWARHVQAGDFQVLERAAMPATQSRTGLLLSGTKLPIVYLDPRVGGYQVQYIDIGFKMDISGTLGADGKTRLDCNVTRTSMTEATPNPFSDGIRTQTRLLLEPGQTASVCTTCGIMTARHMQQSYPNVKFEEGDTVLVTVGIQQ